MINIYAIKTNTAYFISDIVCGTQFDNSRLPNYLINGETPKASFQKHWFIVDRPVELVEKVVSQPSINKRFELSDLSLASSKIKAVYSYDEVTVDSKFTDEFSKIRSLYQYKEDPQNSKKESVDFTFTIIAKVEKVEDFKFSYNLVPNWKGVVESITEKNVKHHLIQQIITPSILLNQTECHLTSKESYGIVRQYIKENIDPKVAVITSDYDFCFGVAKKLPLAAPYEISIEKSKGRKKWKETSYVNTRQVSIFEMTSEEDSYKGYTPIRGFKGSSIEDLKKNIDTYLKDLITFINKPMVECPNCLGKGAI